MKRPSPRSRFSRGFTLIEVILVIAIIAILVGVAIPTFRGMAEERAAREPVRQLRDMARTARLRAMSEDRPYQIAFTSEGFRLTRHNNPYADAAAMEQFLIEAGQGAEDIAAEGGSGVLDAAAEEAAAEGRLREEDRFSWLRRAEVVESYEYEDGMQTELLFWGEPDRVPIGNRVFRQWVFHPSGICNPIRVTFQNGTAIYEVAFSALTAEIENEINEEN